MNKIADHKEFKNLILDRAGLHVVRFCAEWSGASQIMAPMYKELSKIFQDLASFYTVDVDEALTLARELGISKLPSLLFYRDGVLIGNSTGMLSKEMLIEKFKDTFNIKE